MDPVVARALEDAARRGWLEPREGIAVACSGGPDSVFLARALAAAAAKRPLRVAVVHVHHGIRGADADADAAFVERLAADLDLEFALVRLDVPAERRRRGKGSLETVARELRYGTLAAEASRLGLRTVATAHHRDDLLETVLLGLLRGGGLRAVRGVPRERPLAGGLRVVRPLLDVPRAEILRVLREGGIAYREDPTNLDPGPLRNRIRARLLPLLREIGGASLEPSLVRLAQEAGEVDAYLEGVAQERLLGAGTDLSPPVADLPPLVRRRVLRAFLERACGAPASRAAIERVESLLRDPRARRASGPGGRLVRAEGGALRVLPRRPSSPPAASVPLAVPGETRAMGFVFRASLERDAGPSGPPSLREVRLDPALVPSLGVRPRRPGDRIRSAGAPGSKKVSDLFIDRKVPRDRRDEVPLVVSGDRVVWIVDHAVDAAFLSEARPGAVLRLVADPEEARAGNRAAW